MDKNKQNLIKALKALRKRALLGDEDLKAGICKFLRETAAAHHIGGLYPYMIWKGTYLIPIFKTWPKYSGDPDCPIPSLNTDETPFGNYISSAGERWKGEYLNLRLELIDFVIKELEKDDAV